MMMEYLAKHPMNVVPRPQFPAASDRAAWESVDPADRDALLAYADAWREQPYPLLTAGMYAAFVRNGSRTACETPYFDRRRKLCAAALHVCLTGREDDLPIVEDGMLLLCEETAWGISAHVDLTAEHPYPDPGKPIVDLFAAQTAMILAFICQLLEDRLHPDVIRRVRAETEKRVLAPFMQKDDEWWMGFVRKDLNNWTPWIISNVMMAANIWQYDCEALYTRACGMLDRWLACVPEDGGCDEGAGYWNMAGGAFLDCLMLLDDTAGVSLWDDPKVQRMMAYPEKVYLGGGWFANFADCDARPCISSERLEYAGEKTGNPALIRMGVQMRGTPVREVNDTPHMSRILMRLFGRKHDAAALAVPEKDVWLPDLQVRILQKGPFVLCAKGGHNGESHNHNDVGSFIVGVNGQMRLVDAGNMVYTARTFSDSRYELWNCRAAYHNVPMTGGMEQCPGVEYAARNVRCTENGLDLDMAPAYPAKAGVLACTRSLTVAEDAVTVTDRIALAAPQEAAWVFMFREEPTLDASGTSCHFAAAESACFTWPESCTASLERIDVTDRRMQGSYPGALWRLVLTAPAAAEHTACFAYAEAWTDRQSQPDTPAAPPEKDTQKAPSLMDLRRAVTRAENALREELLQEANRLFTVNQPDEDAVAAFLALCYGLSPRIRGRIGYELARLGLSGGRSGFHGPSLHALPRDVALPMPFTFFGCAGFKPWGGIAFRIDRSCFEKAQPDLFFETDAGGTDDSQLRQMAREIADYSREIRNVQVSRIRDGERVRQGIRVDFTLSERDAALQLPLEMQDGDVPMAQVGMPVIQLPVTGEIDVYFGEKTEAGDVVLHRDDFCMK